ncbi:hypothetical protein VTL71DRAFT_14781 [Oculimacula yallundae]|uniref:Uncharacterized protein n=1 Tax=Oculimacula yallundae TaxID=86028 RepID=A0ABR4CKT5_9HELO
MPMPFSSHLASRLSAISCIRSSGSGPVRTALLHPTPAPGRVLVELDMPDQICPLRRSALLLPPFPTTQQQIHHQTSGSLTVYISPSLLSSPRLSPSFSLTPFIATKDNL